jgi:hypothetical protein
MKTLGIREGDDAKMRRFREGQEFILPQLNEL